MRTAVWEMIEASKQIYAGAPVSRERVKRPLYIAAGGGAGSNRAMDEGSGKTSSVSARFEL